MTDIVERILRIHRALDDARLPHAFGGALALAWCTMHARGTIDIDVNVFVDLDVAQTVLGALPVGVRWSLDDVVALRIDGQVRVWWETTPVDVFLNATDLHWRAARRVKVHPFAGAEVPFLGCDDLAVFKAYFNRAKDWADLEAMAEAGALDLDRVVGAFVRYLGGDDPRVERLRALRPAR
jgi:hypothetical protein